MATINVYDSNTGLTKQITIDIQASVIKGSQKGSNSVYVKLTTTARDPRGGAVPAITIREGDFVDTVTAPIKAGVIELFHYINGDYLDETSSSSTHEETTSSRTESSTMMSSSSTSTQHKGNSSSSDTGSSGSSESSASTPSSTYSAHP